MTNLGIGEKIRQNSIIECTLKTHERARVETQSQPECHSGSEAYG
jgi:hypothetical protein